MRWIHNSTESRAEPDAGYETPVWFKNEVDLMLDMLAWAYSQIGDDLDPDHQEAMENIEAMLIAHGRNTQ